MSLIYELGPWFLRFTHRNEVSRNKFDFDVAWRLVSAREEARALVMLNFGQVCHGMLGYGLRSLLNMGVLLISLLAEVLVRCFGVHECGTKASVYILLFRGLI